MPAAATPNAAKIAALEAILNSGARSVTVDGITTTFSTEDQIRRQITSLRAADSTAVGLVKPRVRGLGGVLRGAFGC